MNKILIFLIIFLSGCGTISSQSHEIDYSKPETINEVYIGPFSGVIYDGEWMGSQPVYIPLLLLDMPVSFISDFFILPYTMYRANKKCYHLKCEVP